MCVAPHRTAAAMVLGDRLHDGQAEPDTPGRSGTRAVRPAEAGEDASDRIPRDSHALVLDLDDDLPVASPASAQFDRRMLVGVLHGVVQQRVEGGAQTVRVDLSGPLTTEPSRQVRGATSHQRMKTSSRNDSISISSRRTKPGWPAVASRSSCPRIESMRRSSSSAISRVAGCRRAPRNSSRCPRAIVSGGSWSSCEASWMKRS